MAMRLLSSSSLSLSLSHSSHRSFLIHHLRISYIHSLFSVVNISITSKMLFSALAVSSLFVAVAVAGPEPAPYRVGPMMSSNPAHGLAKRQAGYQPTQHYCNGPGDTCASACGAGFVTCASNDDQTHCYDPSAGYTCCTDGTGSKFLSCCLTL